MVTPIALGNLCGDLTLDECGLLKLSGLRNIHFNINIGDRSRADHYANQLGWWRRSFECSEPFSRIRTVSIDYCLVRDHSEDFDYADWARLDSSLARQKERTRELELELQAHLIGFSSKNGSHWYNTLDGLRRPFPMMSSKLAVKMKQNRGQFFSCRR